MILAAGYCFLFSGSLKQRFLVVTKCEFQDLLSCQSEYGGFPRARPGHTNGHVSMVFYHVTENLVHFVPFPWHKNFTSCIPRDIEKKYYHTRGDPLLQSTLPYHVGNIIYVLSQLCCVEAGRQHLRGTNQCTTHKMSFLASISI